MRLRPLSALYASVSALYITLHLNLDPTAIAVLHSLNGQQEVHVTVPLVEAPVIPPGKTPLITLSVDFTESWIKTQEGKLSTLSVDDTVTRWFEEKDFNWRKEAGYPEITGKPASWTVEIFRRVELLDALKALYPVLSGDETRPVLDSLLFKFTRLQSVCTLVAASSFRLATTEVGMKTVKDVDMVTLENYQVLLPRATVKQLITMLNEYPKDKHVKLTVNRDNDGVATYVTLENEDGTFILGSYCVKGNYPHYEQHFKYDESNVGMRWRVSVKQWVEALEPFIGETTLRSGVNDNGDRYFTADGSYLELDYINVSGVKEKLRFGINPKFLLQALKSYGPGQECVDISFTISSPEHDFCSRIIHISCAGSDLTYAIMPMIEPADLRRFR